MINDTDKRRETWPHLLTPWVWEQSKLESISDQVDEAGAGDPERYEHR